MTHKINTIFLLVYISQLFFRLLKEKLEELLAAYIQGSIQASLTRVFGEIGGAADIEVLNLQPEVGSFVVKTPKADITKVRTAITLIAQFKGIPCHFRVTGIKSVLIQSIQ